MQISKCHGYLLYQATESIEQYTTEIKFKTMFHVCCVSLNRKEEHTSHTGAHGLGRDRSYNYAVDRTTCYRSSINIIYIYIFLKFWWSLLRKIHLFVSKFATILVDKEINFVIKAFCYSHDLVLYFNQAIPRRGLGYGVTARKNIYCEIHCFDVSVYYCHLT